MDQNNNVHFPLKSSQTLLSSFEPEHGDVIRMFQEIKEIQNREPPPTTTKTISHHLLSNGLSVGEFCLWYIASNRVVKTAKCRKNKKAVNLA